MKSRIMIHGLIACICLCTACRSDKGGPADASTAPLGLSVGIVSEEGTRSNVVVEGQSFGHEAQLNVLLVDYAGGGSNDYDNAATYTYKEPTAALGVWIPNDPPNALKVSNKEARVLAHYPALLRNGSQLSANKRTLTPELLTKLDFGNVMTGEYNGDNSFYFASQVGGFKQEIYMADGEVDYLVGAASAPASNQTDASKKATIRMKHCLSMVVFRIRKSPDNTIKGVVKKLTLKNVDSTTGPLRKASFDIQSGTFTPTATRVDYERTMDEFPDGSYFGMMVYPAQLDFLQVRIDLLVDEASTYSILLPGDGWLPGKVNFYDVVLNPIGAELVDEVLVIDWTKGLDHTFEVN